MLEESIVEAAPELYGNIPEEQYQRLYREAFLFGHTSQGILYGMLYEFNNRSGCSRCNVQPPSSRQ
jgi:hypothetical protein